MNRVYIAIQFLLFLTHWPAWAVAKDPLRELAESQSVEQILDANQKAEQEEARQSLCQQQIKERRWPVDCWLWLEQQVLSKRISEPKQKRWQNYLNRFCVYISQQPDTPKVKLFSSSFWQQSRCGILAKKHGLSFENEMP